MKIIRIYGLRAGFLLMWIGFLCFYYGWTDVLPFAMAVAAIGFISVFACAALRRYPFSNWLRPPLYLVWVFVVLFLFMLLYSYVSEYK